MNAPDDFGHDPTVQKTRKYFSRMEEMDTDLLERSGISMFDPRLREARDRRFKLYENTCSRAARKGIRLDEGMVLELFELCQDMAFKACGLQILSLNQSQNPALLSLVKEGHK